MTDTTINRAVRVLNRGGLIIFPTDTAFGIGCRLDNPAAVARLFRVRRRPENQAVPVLVSSVTMAEKYLLSPLPDNVRQLMKDNWPGGLTVICNCRTDLVTPLVRAGGYTLGVRQPDQNEVLEIIGLIGVPLLGPSANFHGANTPYSAKELDMELVSRVDLVIPGECPTKQASTVVDTSIQPWKIIRQGKIVINFHHYKF